MSEGERKLVETAGDYLYAVKNGDQIAEPSWRSCRIVLTSERLILQTNGGKQAIPYSKIRLLDDDAAELDTMVPDSISIGAATGLKIGDNLVLIDSQHEDGFVTEYCKAALHDTVILAKCPAVVGGVVQEDAAWSKARFRLDEEQIKLGLPDNETVSFGLDDVGTIDETSQTVMGEQRTVVKVEHTDEDDRSMQTHFSGMEWHTQTLATLLTNIIEERQNEYELSDLESQVLMALYSGVNPFEMADFVGIDVDEVEEVYQQLLDIGAVDKVRERTEVTLNANGRNLASEAMNEE